MVILFIYALFITVEALFITVEQVFADPESDRNKFKQSHDECQADPKTKVSEDYMKKAARGETPEDPNAGPHTLCMSTKLGYQDASGKVITSKIKDALGHLIKDESKLDEAVKECAVDKDHAEDTAAALWGCMRKVGGEAYRSRQHEHHH